MSQDNRHKKITFSLIVILVFVLSAQMTYGQLRPFLSIQLAADPDNGECLTTDGVNNVWSSSCGGGGGGGLATTSIDTEADLESILTDVTNVFTNNEGQLLPFAWTQHAWGNATSTTLGFLDGFVSSASSTIAGDLDLDGALNVSGTLDSQLINDDGIDVTLANQIILTGSAVGDLALTGANDPNTGVFFQGGDRLHLVEGGASALRIGADSNYNLLPVWITGSSCAEPPFTNDADNTTGICFPTAGDIGFSISGSEIARFDNGNLGIGTTSPYARLSVAGVTVADSFNATNTSATSTFSGGLVFTDEIAPEGTVC
jgi:hypothetical protein